MLNKLLIDLEKKDEYFSYRNPEFVSSWRGVGINEHNFTIKYNYSDTRENIHFFSEQFKILCKKDDKNLKKIGIENFFIKNKNNLTDLIWIVTGYY